MALTDILTQGKEKLYDIISTIVTAFPYSNDLAHVGILGMMPFLVGKITTERIGKRIPALQKYSTSIGFASAGLAELLWQTVIEPHSPYDHSQDGLSDLKGIAETALGATLGYLGTRLTRRFRNTHLEQ